jgi:hypothetical protein
MRERSITPLILNYIENGVSGQLHAHAVLSLGKECMVPTEYKAVYRPTAGLDAFREKKNILACQEKNHDSL